MLLSFVLVFVLKMFLNRFNVFLVIVIICNSLWIKASAKLLNVNISTFKLV